MRKTTGTGQPFFARFLEHQLKKETESNISGGATLKYPSDLEDAETTKYPSDQEDDTTKPAADLPHTDKYPSDNDEDYKM